MRFLKWCLIIVLVMSGVSLIKRFLKKPASSSEEQQEKIPVNNPVMTVGEYDIFYNSEAIPQEKFTVTFQNKLIGKYTNLSSARAAAAAI